MKDSVILKESHALKEINRKEIRRRSQMIHSFLKTEMKNLNAKSGEYRNSIVNLDENTEMIKDSILGGMPIKEKFQSVKTLNSFKHQINRNKTIEFGKYESHIKKQDISTGVNLNDSNNFLLQSKGSGTSLQDDEYSNKDISKPRSGGKNNFLAYDLDIENEDYRRIIICDKVSDSEISSDPEIEREVVHFWIFQPDNAVIQQINYLSLILIFYILIFDPIILAFYLTDTDFSLVFSYLIDLVFIIDMIMNIFIGYYDDDDKLVMNQKRILCNYIMSFGFIIDLVTAFPFTLTIHSEQNLKSSNLGRWTRALKLLRLFRIFKVIRFLKNSSNYSSHHSSARKLKLINIRDSAVRSFLQFLFSFIIFNHISSCIWVYVGRLVYPNWISSSNLLDSSSFELYISALYFNFTTILSIGYGDIHASNAIERVFNIILMIFGLLLYSFAISILSSTVEKQQKKERKANKNFELFEEIKRKYKIKEELATRVKKYLKFNRNVNKYDKNRLLNDLPTHLRNSIIYKMFEKTLTSLNFFHKTCDEFKYRAAIMLKHVVFNKNEYLIQTGDIVEEVYMIEKGYLQIEMETIFNINKKLKILVLNKNEHFGEVYMTLNMNSPVDVRVSSKIAVICYLKKMNFLELNEEFPETIKYIVTRSWKNAIQIESKAKKLYKRLEKYSRSSLSKYEEMLVIQEDVHTCSNPQNKKTEVESLVNNNDERTNSPPNLFRRRPNILVTINEEPDLGIKESEIRRENTFGLSPRVTRTPIIKHNTALFDNSTKPIIVSGNNSFFSPQMNRRKIDYPNRAFHLPLINFRRDTLTEVKDRDQEEESKTEGVLIHSIFSKAKIDLDLNIKDPTDVDAIKKNEPSNKDNIKINVKNENNSPININLNVSIQNNMNVNNIKQEVKNNSKLDGNGHCSPKEVNIKSDVSFRGRSKSFFNPVNNKSSPPIKKKNRNSFHNMFYNMREMTNTIRNPKTLLNRSFNKNIQSNQIEQQINKISDIFEDILIYYASKK